jgi:hypothetical protein
MQCMQTSHLVVANECFWKKRYNGHYMKYRINLEGSTSNVTNDQNQNKLGVGKCLKKNGSMR